MSNGQKHFEARVDEPELPEEFLGAPVIVGTTVAGVVTGVNTNLMGGHSELTVTGSSVARNPSRAAIPAGDGAADAVTPPVASDAETSNSTAQRPVQPKGRGESLFEGRDRTRRGFRSDEPPRSAEVPSDESNLASAPAQAATVGMFERFRRALVRLVVGPGGPSPKA